MVQHGKVFSTIADAQTSIIFVENHIERPMWRMTSNARGSDNAQTCRLSLRP